MRSALLLAPAVLAAAPPEPYRALGTEPFWSLTIDRGRITYRPMEGRPTSVAAPRPIIAINGELYRTRELTVDVTHVRCSDGMSDRSYADTVRVTIARRTLSGCGGAIVGDRPADPVIAGTAWRITAIDGRPVRIDRPATVSFTRDRIKGRICNSFGGGYRLIRGRLTTGGVVATRMACAGGATAVENAFLTAIARPLLVSRGNRDTLVLSSGRTSVTLRRER